MEFRQDYEHDICCQESRIRIYSKSKLQMTNISNILKSSTNNDNNNNDSSNTNKSDNDNNNSIYYNKNIREKIDSYVINNNFLLKSILLKKIQIFPYQIQLQIYPLSNLQTQKRGKRINSLLLQLNLQNEMHCKVSNCN